MLHYKVTVGLSLVRTALRAPSTLSRTVTWPILLTPMNQNRSKLKRSRHHCFKVANLTSNKIFSSSSFARKSRWSVRVLLFNAIIGMWGGIIWNPRQGRADISSPRGATQIVPVFLRLPFNFQRGDNSRWITIRKSTSPALKQLNEGGVCGCVIVPKVSRWEMFRAEAERRTTRW